MKKKNPALQQPGKQKDILVKRPAKNEFLIVGIGASAGGIQALRKFFEQVPAGSGLAYVVILHLSPDHDSQLAEVLQAVASIPVTQVTEKVLAEKNHVYVVSPNHHLEMIDGSITVTKNTLIEERRAPVDIFFRTLAESHQSRAVAVILSGTGANGSMGIKRIKEKGGVCFVQNPREAEFSEMPRNSIATNLVDDVLPVREIPAKIIAYKESLGKIKIPEEPVERPEEQQLALREIFAHLRVSTGHDFTNYKRPTLLRRIERRVNVRGLATLSEYAIYLNEHAEEVQSLLKDLLISVTNFFRDSKTFDYIEKEVVPQILSNKHLESQVRVWVAGCATGEEAYSLAMIFAEQVTDVDAPKIQIFATDIDEDAIAAAREGIYTINDAADVSPERLHRFFVKEGKDFRIRRELREMVLFAHHNAIKDPPFSHLDMVSCRNLLIYLNQIGQERLMETFHFALETGSFLMLGMSETIDGSGDLYTAASREYRIYKSRETPARMYPVPESVPQFRFDKIQITEATQNKDHRNQERVSYGQLHGRLLEQYAPPSVIINEVHDIVHVSESAGRFLQIAGGEPTQNILKLIKPELRLELMSALFQAVKRRSNIQIKNIKVNTGNADEVINVHVRPVLKEDDDASGFVLVLFEPAEDEKEETVVLPRNEPVAKQLEEELTRLKTQLRSAVEQHEYQSEELKASNEEFQAINEELRSATEELETSKEELQSINEELITVNQELKIKIEEISLSGNNLQNLINSTDIGTIFLDRSLRVNMFTPAACNIFNLIANDFGRPLSDITHRLKNVNLQADAEAVLNKLTPVEREVETNDGKSFLMKVLPYRTAEDRINGVVVTFVDITQRKQAEESLRNSEERFRAFVTASTDVIYTMNADWTEMYNLRSEGFLSITENTNATWLQQYIPQDTQPEVFVAIEKAIETKTVFELEHQVISIDGSTGWVFSRAVPLFNEQNEIKEWFGAASDITKRKQAQQMLKESEERLQLAINGAGIVIWQANPPTGITRYTGETKNAIGFEISENALQNFNTTHPDDKEFVAKAIENAISGKAPLDIEHRIINPENGEVIWLKAQGQLINRTQHKPAVFIGITQNITKRKLSEEALRASEERLQKAMQIETVGVVFFDNEGNFKDANDTFLKMTGYTRKQFENKGLDAEDVTPPDWMQRTMEALKELNETGVETPYEKEFQRADGKRWWGLTAGASIQPNENVKYIIDVTGRRKAEQALQESEARYRIALQSADMAAWDWQVKEDKIIWNDQHHLLFGLQPDDKPKNADFFISFVHEDDVEMVKNALQNAVEHTGVYHAEFRIRRADNQQVRWMNGFGKVVEKQQEEATRMVGVMFDITDRKQLELQKEDFISIASHELKTPVTSIKAYAEVLHDMFTEAENTGSAALIKKLDMQVDRLIDLIHALLDTSKIAEGKLQLHPEQFNFGELVEERVADLQRLSSIHHLIINSTQTTTVTADRERIGQVLTNFISNAIKYSPKGGDVIINWQQTNEGTEVSMHDMGIGIKKEELQRVFDRFFRAQNAGLKSYPGMGLGLYITANIVQSHGGRIWVESVEGDGSVFYFTIPSK